MELFNKFIISDYYRDSNNFVAFFRYSFDDQEFFTETIDFKPLKDSEKFPIINNDREKIDQILAHLHIALGVSYYKLCPTKDIIVKTISLDQNQKKFWNDFYLKGLGEFFYRNKLDPRGLANFISYDGCKKYNERIDFNAKKLLVLFGGGKDSLVSVEILKEMGESFDLFSFGRDFPLHELAQKPTGANRIIIKRMLDTDKITALLERGYYNGHLPITGIISFVTVMIGYLYGYKGVVASLEKSADEGNTTYYDMEINHQWSKSKEFEDLFKNYIRDYITDTFSVKSYLRDWYEIKVVKKFSKYPQYFHSFSSCNRNFHLIGPKTLGGNLRCGECPKCCFVYTMLRAFIGKEETNKIFNKDLLEDEKLDQLFKELLGIDGIKPFECVGTNEEMVLAFRLICKKEPNLKTKITEIFKEKILSSMHDEDFEKLREKLGV